MQKRIFVKKGVRRIFICLFFEGVSCVVISPSLSLDEGIGMPLIIQTKWLGCGAGGGYVGNYLQIGLCPLTSA